MALIEMDFAGGGGSSNSGLPILSVVSHITSSGTVEYNFTNDYSHILVIYLQQTQALSSVVYPVGATIKQELVDGTYSLYEFENVASGTFIRWTSTGWGNAIIYTF